MPNFVAVLKEEIRRLARKEAKALLSGVRRAKVQYRRDIAGLKRLTAAHQRTIEFLEKQERARVAQPALDTAQAGKVRFSPRWLASHRKKLRLSAAEYAQLLGVTSQSIYNWEKGGAKPRKAQVVALAAIRKLRRREAMTRLAVLAGQAKAAPVGKGRRGRRGRKAK